MVILYDFKIRIHFSDKPFIFSFLIVNISFLIRYETVCFHCMTFSYLNRYIHIIQISLKSLPHNDKTVQTKLLGPNDWNSNKCCQKIFNNLKKRNHLNNYWELFKTKKKNQSLQLITRKCTPLNVCLKKTHFKVKELTEILNDKLTNNHEQVRATADILFQILKSKRLIWAICTFISIILKGFRESFFTLFSIGNL